MNNKQICPRCKTEVVPDFKFCPECGRRIIQNELSHFTNLEWYSASENNMAEFEKVWGDLAKGEAKDAIQFFAEKHRIESRYGIRVTFRDWTATDAYYKRYKRADRDFIETEWVSPEDLRYMLEHSNYDKSGSVFYSDVSWAIQLKIIKTKKDLETLDNRFFKTEREAVSAVENISAEFAQKESASDEQP